MKKVFIGYRFTGEILSELQEMIKNIESALEKYGYDSYCSLNDEEFFQNNKYTNGQISKHALKELDKADLFLAVIKTQEKSEGMLMEAGYALAKNIPAVVAIQNGVKTTSLTELADQVISFETLEDLYQKLSSLSPNLSRPQSKTEA